MIHSMAGGVLGNETYNDFAMVEIIEGAEIGKKYWYISIAGIADNDLVIVSLRNEDTKARVIRVDKNISSYASPVPIKVAKKIKRKVQV